MAITGNGAAGAIVAALDSSGAFDSITDTAQRAEVRAQVLAGLELHYEALVAYLVANIEVTIPAGQRVDNLMSVQIGVTANPQTGSIS